ncbi:uncharacterized protein isoform X2 [Musca autumnalis]|uniref:uncharacterized protein isoform X2 n=1 Tax=Musca autumnalis TaxID=221902 RepID=UPI003CF4350E
MFSKSPVFNIATKNVEIAKKCLLHHSIKRPMNTGMQKPKFKSNLKASSSGYRGLERHNYLPYWNIMRQKSSDGKKNGDFEKSLDIKKINETLETINPNSSHFLNQSVSHVSNDEESLQKEDKPSTQEPRTILKKVFKKRSRQESREALNDPANMQTRRRGSKRRIMIVQLLENNERDNNNKSIESPDIKSKQYKLEILADHEGIANSILTPKKVHIEYMEEENRKDIELEKKPSIQTPSSSSSSVAIKNDTKKAIYNAETDQLTKQKVSKDNQIKSKTDSNGTPENSTVGGTTPAIKNKENITKNIADEKIPKQIETSKKLLSNINKNHPNEGELLKDGGSQLKNVLDGSSIKHPTTNIESKNMAKSSTPIKEAQINFTKDEIKLNNSNTKSNNNDSIFLMSLTSNAETDKLKDLKKSEFPLKIAEKLSSAQNESGKANVKPLPQPSTKQAFTENNSNLPLGGKSKKVITNTENNPAYKAKTQDNANMNTITKPKENIKNPPKSSTKCPKNMFGECMTPEQLQQNQEKLKIFQQKKEMLKKENKIAMKSTTTKKLSGGPVGGNRNNSKGSNDNTWNTLIITTIYVGISLLLYGVLQTNSTLWQNLLESLKEYQNQEKFLIQTTIYQKDMKNTKINKEDHVDNPPQNMEAIDAETEIGTNLKEV